MDIEILLAIKITLDVIALHRDANDGPAIVMLDIRALKGSGPLAVHDLVDPEVLLKVVVAGDVVILGVPGSPDQTAPLVELTGDGLDLHGDVHVLEVRVFDQ